MKKAAILILVLFAALATSTIAQSDKYQNQTAVNVSANDGNDSMRPRRVDDRVADVKSSIVVSTSSVERIAFDILNQKRSENGLRPLAWSDELETLARQHSQDMAENKYFSHRGLDNSMVSDRADKSGLRKWRSIGENIAFNRGYKDPIEVAVKLWMESTSHRHNLLDGNWKESAIGIAIAADGSYYFTQVFLLRK